MRVLNFSSSPDNLTECFAELKKRLPQEELDRIGRISEKDMVLYHSNLGRTLRNKWGLWTGSRLQTFFFDLGLQHADDMSGVILDSFWRHIHNKPILLEKQVARYQKYWKGVEINENGTVVVEVDLRE